MQFDYDVAIIGGGSGGLVVASSMSQLDMRVLLIEKERLGGDCLWYGCVPSKALIAIGKRIQTVSDLEKYGLPKVRSFTPDFKKVMARMRNVQGTIQPHDSPERFRKLGADVRFGEATFVDAHTLQLKGKKLTFKYGVIATGSGPRVPAIPGLEKAGYLTNVTVFSLKKLPKELVIIGGGPIGVELAQVFSRFGAKVTMIVRSTLLSKEDPAIVAQLQKVLEAEGITFIFKKQITKVTRKGKKKQIDLKGHKQILCDEILVATGRVANVEGLDLENAGIVYSTAGIEVNDALQTATKNIFAIGDVVGGLQFTHMAGSHAGTVVRNIITPVVNSKAETVVPWVTYTDPELARVGMTKAEAEDDGLNPIELTAAFADNDRAIAEEEIVGEARVVVDPSGKMLGATILGPNAGELIMEWVIAIKKNLKVTDIVGVIHPYPTLSGINGAIGSAWYKRKLNDTAKKVTQFLVRKF